METPDPSRDLIIRKMKGEESGTVAEIHIKGFPGYFLSRLGRRFLTLYYDGIRADPQGIALVGEKNRVILGFAAGMMNPAGFYTRLLRRRWFWFMLAAIPGAVRHPSFLPRLFRALWYPRTSPGGGSIATLASIAVRPEAKGSGIGKQLMREFIAEVKRRGGTELMWGSKKREEAANRFYQRFGYSEMREFRDSQGDEIIEYSLRI